MSDALPPPPDGMPVKTRRYRVPPKQTRQDMRDQFNSTERKHFLKDLAESHADELRAMGIPKRLIDRMGEEGRVPRGFEVHHKLPIHGGGQNTARNLTLIRKDHHQALHAFVNPQLEGMRVGDVRMVKIPTPDGMVFNHTALTPPKHPKEASKAAPSVSPARTHKGLRR